MTAKNTKPKINELDYNNKDKIYVNNKGYKFKIIDRKSECSIAKSGNKKWTTKYLVKFDSGFEIWSAKKEICNPCVAMLYAENENVDCKAPYMCELTDCIIVRLQEEMNRYNILSERKYNT